MTHIRHVVLLLISAIYSVSSSEYRLSAQAFAAWNNVPTAVNLGLFNNETSSEDQITRVELINGTCFQYDIRQFTRCKYYGDCCAMTPTRAMERLAKDTFSCHDGFYIVDRCPETTYNEELEELCNGNNTNAPELSLKRWPVRGVVNHLTYKNIYCAICNGLDPQAEVNLTDPNLRRFQSDELLYDALQKVEWWPALVRCDSHAIQSYIRDDPTFTKLNHLVKSACMLHYKPPEAPDLCWDALKSCPANTNSEIANLCHTGPANYMEINSKVFWNQFCAMCNNVSIVSSQPVRMPDRDLSNMEILWEQERLRLGKKNEYSSCELLTALKPKINTEMVEMTVNDDSFVNLSGIVTVDCSEFVDGKRSFCKQNSASSSRESDNYPVWDLGSMSCYSPFQKICEWFIPEPEGTDQECSKMGCGKGKIIDPSTNQCIDLSDFPVSRPQEKDDLEWSSASICEYESQCRAAELGLINEEQLNCFCDKYCIYYNDCCVDSRFQSNSSLALDPGVFGCYDNNLPPEDYHRWIMWGVMEITKCPLNYRGNQTLVALCDESIFYESRRRWWNLVMIPVTDPKTGLRYGNIYCAKCHGVDEVKYWKIELSSDSKVEGVCEKPFSSYELDTLREMRIDPPIDKVADECFVKAFLPPEGHEDYRICRVDASEYISTCPNETKNWKIGKLCAEKPASFVYSSNILQSQLDWERIETTESKEMFGSIPFTTHRSAVKYRNSYCATCNDAVWLGCRLSTGVDINYRETSLWYNNFRKRKMSLVNFVLDLNSQSCSRHSDLYITHSNHETGLDTCDRVTEALRECPCNSIYDLSVGGCKTTPFTNPSCNETGWEAVVDDPSTRLTDYTSLECPMLDTSPLNFTAVEEICSRCKQNPSLSECDPVYVLPTLFNHTMLPSIHCVNTLSPDPTLLPVCKQTPIPYRCFKSFAYSGTGSALSQSIMGKEIKLLNSVAVRYDPALYPLVIPAHTKDKQGVGLEILYARSVSSGDQFCSNYSFINNKAEKFLYCQGNGLQSNLSGEYFDNFIISGKELGVCVEYDLAGFKLNIQDYILSGISIAAILIYLLHYCLKDKKTLTSKFVVSSLVTLVLALVSYCLTNTFADSKTACRAVASLTQYFMIGVHSWTCALAIWMVRGLQSLRLVHDRGLSNYLKYALFAWSLPAVFVTAALLLDNFKVEQLSPVYSPYFCFIGDGWIRVAVFTGPIYLIVLVNVGLCIFAMVKVLRTGKGVSQADKRRTKKKILTVSKLQAVFGLHWILLFFTEIEGKHVKTLWMVLNTLVTLQGVTIVLTQVIDLDTFTRLSRMVSSVSGASTRTVSYTISNSGSSKRSDKIENDKRTKHDSGHAVVPYPDQASPL